MSAQATVDLSIAIGRNVGATPMNEPRWISFYDEILDAVPTALGNIIVGEFGESFWRNNGVLVNEDHARIVVLGVPARRLDSLRRKLASIAHRYGQDSIALFVGKSELISAVSPKREKTS